MKTFKGTLVSDKMTKAAIVLIERKFHHPLYGKILTKKRKIHAVNEIGAKVGQEVEIVETRPISKTISFKITKVLGLSEKGSEEKEAEKE